MYPKFYLDLFERSERNKTVFVAMPFSPKFNSRWQSIFKPAITTAGFRPLRFRERLVSDSIPTEILTAIVSSAAILADTSMEAETGGKGFPNPNVMYELGIAHTVRIPEEVLVVRDGQKGSHPFDIAHIRYVSFDEKEPARAKKLISEALRVAARDTIAFKKQLVSKALASLDPDMIAFLDQVRKTQYGKFDLALFDPDRKGLFGLPTGDCSEEHLRELARELIRQGVLVSQSPLPLWKRIYGGTAEYSLTKFGAAVLSQLPPLEKKPTPKEIKSWRDSLLSQAPKKRSKK